MGKVKIFVATVLMFMVSGPVHAQDIAGYVELQKGQASRQVATTTSQLAKGDRIYVGDTIKTGPQARLLILFEDASSLTLGEQAEIVVDDFVYVAENRNPSGEKQALTILKGVFQYVSGQISKENPQQMALATPVATIGIRGTTFVGGELTVGMPPGQPHYGFQINEGAIEVITPSGSVVLNEPGEGTFLPLDRLAAPTPVRQWTAEEAAEAQAAIAF